MGTMKKLVAALAVCFAVLVFTILHINQYQDIRTTLLRDPPLNAIRHYLSLQQVPRKSQLLFYSRCIMTYFEFCEDSQLSLNIPVRFNEH